MGTITTEGKASRLVQFDRLNTVVTFHSRSRLTGKTIKTALEDCEKFLHTISDMGIDLDSLEAGANNTNRDTYGDDNEVETDREVVLRSGYDLNLMNVIMHIVEQNGFDADVDFSPELSGVETIKTELYAEAARDSKEKADRIARSINMEITGLDKLETDSCFGFIPDEYLSGGVKGNMCPDQLDRFSAYSKLSSQQTRVEVTVKGIWKTE